MSSIFRLSDYDSLGFDMDHTVVQYHLPEHFQLVYRSLATYLIEKKGYDKHLLDEDFVKYEDFSLRGLIFETARGNTLKVDDNGYILRACHGMTPLSKEEIRNIYGKCMYWENFPELKKNVFHGGKGKSYFRIFENFFDMPAAVISARLVDVIDQTQGPQDEYKFWPDVLEALGQNFSVDSFRINRGNFFPSLKNNPEKFVKKCPEEVIAWLKKVKQSGKVTFLLTGSYIDFTEFLMDYAIGKDWTSLFDFVFTYAGKPDFFKLKGTEKPFLGVTSDLKEGNEVHRLDKGSFYSRGNASVLKDTIRTLVNKDNPKIVYFGDSPKSDVYPPFAYSSWDTVAVLEEMEAEEVHFHKSKSQDMLADLPAKRPKITPLLKEEKLFIASQLWGSFFCHFTSKSDSDNEVCPLEKKETFWTSIIRRCSKIAIPLLDYITDLDLDYPFQAFSENSEGFYPGPPSTFHECVNNKSNDSTASF